MLCESDVSEKLKDIIKEVRNVEIKDIHKSLFSTTYDIQPDEMANILLKARKELGFIINTNSIEFCEEFSFQKVVNSIVKYNTN